MLAAQPAVADVLRIATFGAALSRDGPGLLLRDILRGEDPQVAASAAIIATVAPDVLLLSDFDFDAGGAALEGFAAMLRAAGVDYPHRFARQPNTGLATGLDMDGNGRLGEARDAQGYGRFAGDGGMAILSRLPIDAAAARDFSDHLWRDLPGATLPVHADGTAFPSPAAQAVQRLSTAGHWVVPVIASQGPLTLLAHAATPPAFDGSEGRNRLRNRDELLFWRHYLDGAFGAPPDGAFVMIGKFNLDPDKGAGFNDAMATVLADPRLQDPRPQSRGALVGADPARLGDSATDTASWKDGRPVNMRVSYVLPSADWRVTGAGVFWPAPDDPLADLLGPDGLAAGPHRLVWVDVMWADAAQGDVAR